MRTASFVDQDNFDTTPNGDAPTVTAPDQVISAILGARRMPLRTAIR